MANTKDLATSTVATAPSPAASGTSLVVQTGHGTRFPTAPFYATVHADGTLPTLDNSEVVLVTAVATDTLTITRTQKSTSARSILVGDRISNTVFSEDVTPVGTMVAYAGRTAPTGYLMCYGQAVSRTTYAALFQTISPLVGEFTVSVASPGVVTLNGHGFLTGDAIYLTTSGALPTGLSANTIYYVSVSGANTFYLATSRANAHGASYINTSGTQSGTHSLYACPYGLGDGSTTFNVPDARGRVIAGTDGMGGTQANRLILAATQSTYGELGASGGEERHQLTTAELAAHTHIAGYSDNNWKFNSASLTQQVLINFDPSQAGNNATNTTSAGSDTPHNNVQPTIITNYIIRT